MTTQAILNSYMVTNRCYPWETWSEWIYPVVPPVAPVGTNFYLTAAGANNSNSNAFPQENLTATSAMPPGFLAALETDIASAVANGGPQVTLYIHGLSYLLSDACYTLGTFGQNLTAQGYQGLLIGFSWPSYGKAASTHYYGSLPYSFPPAFDSGTIRDNINGSTQSLLLLLNQLVPLCQNGVRLNLVTHSEGNYMLMLAMAALDLNPGAFPNLKGRFIDQVLMVAADINSGALLMAGSTPGAGQGSAIAQHANTVTIYWSSNDTLLPFSEEWLDYHNPFFPDRLGLDGPASVTGGVIANVYGLDCSLVANEENPYIPWDISVHESYFYIPQILEDMKQTLTDTPPADVAYRKRTGDQSFQMADVSSLQRSALWPSGTRLPKKVPPER